MAGENSMSTNPSEPRPVRRNESLPRPDSSSSLPASRASVTARLATPIASSPTGRSASAVAIPQPENPLPLAGSPAHSAPRRGASSLSQALRGTQQSSLVEGSRASPYPPKDVPGSVTPQKQPPRALHGSFQTPSYPTQLGRSPSGKEDIEVLRRHLVGPQAGSEPGSWRRGDNLPKDHTQATPSAGENEFSSLQLQGGDTTRHIYRYAERMERKEEARSTGRLRRSLSLSSPKPDNEVDGMAYIQMPGGFRREHISRTAASPAPSGAPRRPNYGTLERAQTEPARPRFVTSNFIEFLTIYGHFAGEELEEDDEVLGRDEYFSSDAYDDANTEGEDARSDDGWGEDSALLRKRKRKQREAGKGTPFGAALLLLKSFVGTGVLFLPRAYLNGGMSFSIGILLVIALLSYYCFGLLVKVRLAVPVSYGDMGGKIYGAYFRNLINFSLVLSQVGFSSAYIVFVAENLQAFVLAVSNCRTSISVPWMILLQMVVFLPMSLYRNINHIQKLALAADVFILLGLIYVYFYDIKTIVGQRGIADIQQFNAESWTLLIGTAIFAFEGVGLVIPIQSGVAEPKKFPAVMATVMAIVSVVFISAGALSYAAYGSSTKAVILLNMPQDDRLVNAVQFIYVVAILMSTPLQIYPAIEITSQQLFSRTGKYNPWIKWKKNVFRFFMVALCAGIAWAGADDLDKFVSLVGSFACVPLVYAYPPLMHYRVVATKTWQRVTNILLVILGIFMMAYTSALTIMAWVRGTQNRAPGYCESRGL